MRPPKTGPVVEGEWRRDLAWGIRCHCGHDKAEHRQDQAGLSCSIAACGCTRLRPQYVTWREIRTVYALIEETS